jgi:hypothetical protein
MSGCALEMPRRSCKWRLLCTQGKIVAIHAVVDQVNPIRWEACPNCVHVSVLADNREMGESELTNFQLTHGHAASVNRCHRLERQ